MKNIEKNNDTIDAIMMCFGFLLAMIGTAVVTGLYVRFEAYYWPENEGRLSAPMILVGFGSFYLSLVLLCLTNCCCKVAADKFHGREIFAKQENENSVGFFQPTPRSDVDGVADRREPIAIVDMPPVLNANLRRRQVPERDHNNEDDNIAMPSDDEEMINMTDLR